jgi:hypothetical protein
MSNELTTYATASIDERLRYAQHIASAGQLVPAGLRDGSNPHPGKVLLAMEYATMLGLHPIVGISNINVIDGKVSIPPALMSALVRRAGHTLHVVTEGTIEDGDFKATATLTRTDDSQHPFSATWTPHRAQRAGLCSYAIDPSTKLWSVRARSQGGKAMPWEQYTEAMCKARAISEVCMEGATDVVMGAYTPEELGGDVDAEGVVVTAQRLDGQESLAETSKSDAALDHTQNAAQGVSVDPGAAEQWIRRIAEIKTSAEARIVYGEARDAGVLNDMLTIDGVEAITQRGVELLDVERKGASSDSSDEASDDDVVDAEIVDGEVEGQQTIDDVMADDDAKGGN